MQHQYQHMGELRRRPPGLAPSYQTGRTESGRGDEHSTRSKESQEEGKAMTVSAVITFPMQQMQQRLPLTCRAVQPLAKVQIDLTTWMLHYRLTIRRLPMTVLPGTEPNGIFQYDSQLGKSSSVSYDTDLFAEWFAIWPREILPQFLFLFCFM